MLGHTSTINQKARILVACARQGYPRLFAVLSGHELSFVGTLAESHAALQTGQFDLVMTGLSFDESRMFDLLRHLKDRDNRVPVICFRGVKRSDDSGNLELSGIEAACKEAGAAAFVDLLTIDDDAVGNSRIRTLIYQFLENHKSAGPET